MTADELLGLENRLDAFAEDAVEYPCYVRLIDSEREISGGSATLYVHSCDDFCPECADLLATLLNRAGAGEGDEGGIFTAPSEIDQEDGPSACGWCGTLIAYSLSARGVVATVEHLDSMSPSKALSKGEAYELARVIQFTREEVSRRDPVGGGHAEDVALALRAIERIAPAVARTVAINGTGPADDRNAGPSPC